MGYIRKEYVCDNSDILHKAKEMGYDWNTACDWMQSAGIHGEDGCGYTYVYHSKIGDDYGYNEDLSKVIDALLDEEGLSQLQVLDD